MLQLRIKDKAFLGLIKKWLKAGILETDGKVIHPITGCPQGGVISPLLANMFMHYAFDMWMDRNFPYTPFERYADDAVIHCRTEIEAEKILKALDERMKTCKLELHPQKTKIVYCKDKDRINEYSNVEFDFLGYTFKGVFIKCRTGKMGINFIASASKKANKLFRAKIKALEIHKKTGSKIDMIAELISPIIRGWINYFGKYNPAAIKYTLDCVERRIVKWVMCKFKRFRGHRKRAETWLSKVRKREPNLFAHWKYRKRNVVMS